MSDHFEAQLEDGALVIRVPVKVQVVRREDLPANVLLTRGELEVYELLREHRRDKEIAKLLGDHRAHGEVPHQRHFHQAGGKEPQGILGRLRREGQAWKPGKFG